MKSVIAEKTNQTTTVKSRTPILTLVVDPGTSCIKTIYSKGRRGQPRHLTTNSLAIPSVQVKQGQTYVKLPNEEQFYLVGKTAAKSKDSICIKLLKSEYLVYRVLGVVGEMAKKLSLPSNFRIKLTTFLPISEIYDARFLKPEIIQALKKFEYSGQTYHVDCIHCGFNVEGEGVYKYNQFFNKSNTYHEGKTSACIMFGYRNTSLLLFDNNEFDYSNSRATNIGFYNYLDTISCNGGSGLDREAIKKAIVTTRIKPVNRLANPTPGGFKSEIVIENLIQGTSKKQRDRERQSIKEAVTIANQEYYPKFLRWLKDSLPPLHELDRVIYCGGSAPFFQPQLEEFFSGWNGTLIDTNQMAKTMMDKLQIPASNQKVFIEQSLPLRFADAWGEFVSLAKVEI